MALRFLSSKKSETETNDESPAKKSLSAVMKHRAGSKTVRAQADEPSTSHTNQAKNLASKHYIPFDKLPKPPKEITDMSLDKFYAKVYMRDLPERPEITPSNQFIYNFEVPSQFVRARKPDQKQNENHSFEPAHNILEFKVEYDNNNMLRSPEHPLKESITGMFVSNPLMSTFDNDYLWDMYPRGKVFGNVPFGGDSSFNGFKNWEKGENEKAKEKGDHFESKLQEMKEFNLTLNETNSFYRKSAASSPTKTSKTETKKAGGRRKLDRGLLKQYRKYKKEGWLRRKLSDEDEDDKF